MEIEDIQKVFRFLILLKQKNCSQWTLENCPPYCETALADLRGRRLRMHEFSTDGFDVFNLKRKSHSIAIAGNHPEHCLHPFLQDIFRVEI